MGKTKSKKQAEQKKIKKSAYTGRIVNGKDVILVDEAEEYLKKIGYKIIRPEQQAVIYTFTLTFLITGFHTLLNNITI